MKVFLRNRNNVLTDFRNHIEETTNLLEADVCLLWTDVIEPFKKIVQLCKDYNKPCIVVEHGMRATTDYTPRIKDVHLNFHTKELIADYFFCWGKKSYDDMIEAGVDSSRLRIIGSPIAYEYHYLYENGSDLVRIKSFLGNETLDPSTQKRWKYVSSNCQKLQYLGGNILTMFPHHDWTTIARKYNKDCFDRVKHYENLFIKGSMAYRNTEDINPFKELLELPEDERRLKFMSIDHVNSGNIVFLHSLLKRSMASISVINGTINGLCHVAGIPVIVPKYDFGLRDDNNNVIYNETEADIMVEPEMLSDIDSCLNLFDKDKTDRVAVEWMGIDQDNPTDNMLRYIKELIDARD